MHPRPNLFAAVLCLALPAFAPLAAHSGEWGSISGASVVSLSQGTGERSGQQGGFGKLDLGGDSTQPQADAIIAWRPQLFDGLGAVATVSTHLGRESTMGLDEAYLTLRANPGQGVRLSGRVGMFFPPASLEHDGTEWGLRHTLTASALNSWIAEEVKVVGVEVTARGTFAGRPTGLTLAAFQGNDTSGALLAFRGWSLHNRRAVLGGTFPVGPLSPMFLGGQGTKSHSIDEVDGRVGYYGRLELPLGDTAVLNLFAYDNLGDRTTITDGQYAWRTRFHQLSLNWTPNDKTVVLAQVMSGNAGMGRRTNGQYPADIGFAGGFGLISRDVGPGNLTLRVEQFSIDDRSFKAIDNNAEHGWSTTLNWSQPLREQLSLALETTLVKSDHPARSRIGISRDQTSLATRAALKMQF